MDYESWAKTVPEMITGDSLWRVQAYRLALFLADLAWYDASKLAKDKRTLDLASQLFRAVGSIEANISEGYSRGGGRDRARFYEYALGSARESRGWYYKSRHVLGEDVATHRMGLLTQIVRLLLTIIPDQRSAERFLHEESPEYLVEPQPTPALTEEDVSTLTKNAPMP